MKLIKAILVFVFMLSAFADIGPVNRSTNLDFDGSLKSGSREVWKINVVNRSGGTLADGSAVIWDVSEDDGYSVTTSTTAGQTPACIIAESCADDALCECQVYGYKEVILFDAGNASATAGGKMFISENNAAYVQADSSEAASDEPIGIFYDTSAASGSVEGFIRLR